MIGKIDQKWDQFKGATDTLLVDPLKEAKGNYLRIYKKDKKKAIWLLVILLSILVASFFISYILFGRANIRGGNTAQNEYYYSTTMARGEGDDIDLGEDVTVSSFLESYKWALDFFTPIFDSFISQTADVTGKSTPSGNGYSFSLTASNQTEFITGTSIQPATVYYSKALVLIVPIAVLLIIIKAFNFIASPENQQESVFGYFKRVIGTIVLLIITPTIMSLSIVAVNLLSKQFIGNGSLTDFMLTFIERLEEEYSAGTADYIVSIFTNITGMGILGFINSLPIILPLTLILLLFLYVAFQFIIRFLNLYFLAAVYPFAVVFNMHDKTANIQNSFWKQWTSLLIHQPVFVLGYSIVQNLLDDMLNSSGVGLEQILIFLGFLLFLASINMIASRIWGDVYTAISQNISAGLGTMLASKAITTPKNIAQEKVQSFKSGAFGGLTTGVSSYTGKKFGEKVGLIKTGGKSAFSKGGSSEKGIGGGAAGGDISGGTVRHKGLTDGSGSFMAQDLKKQGYDIASSDPSSGVLSVGGDFYGYKDSKSGLTTLYTSQKDATLDGIAKDKVEKVSVSGLNIRDTSNKVGTQTYNQQVGKFAKEKDFKGKVHLTSSASDGWVRNNMRLAKGYNQARNVAGVAVKRYAQNAKRGDPEGKIQKIHVYNEMLEE